jgi:hypothetical protein
MKIIPALIMLAALAQLASAQTPATPKGFDAYGIVKTRNIFDPDRNPFVPTFAPPRPRSVERPRRYSDTITLTGVMVNNGKAYAFFFGGQPDDDKVIGVNGVIGGAKVTKITAASAELNQNGKAISVPVGQSVSIGDGSITPASSGAAPSYSTSEAPPSDSPSQPATPPPGYLNDVMRRMMERRQQQLQ